jgi:hypothetical protein
VFTARYELSPYIKQIRFVFKGLIKTLTKGDNAASLISQISVSLSTDFGCCRVGTPKVQKFFQRIVREVVTYREDNNVTRADYLQHLINLSKKGSIADEKDISNGHAPQQNSTYTLRFRTLFMFGVYRVRISSLTPTVLSEIFLSHLQQLK